MPWKPFFVFAALLLTLPLGVAAQDAVDDGSVAALNEGNRFFREGEIEEAVEAYEAGYSATNPNPTLVYNLATALHHVDRLPEAILWYRRAEGSDDPWLAENLWLARRSLGSQVLPASGLVGLLARSKTALRWTAVVLAWLAFLGVVVFHQRSPSWLNATLASLALVLYLTAFAVGRWGPRPSVLMEDCITSAGELPAGTEAWVRRVDNGYRVTGSQVICPEEAVALVFPEN